MHKPRQALDEMMEHAKPLSARKIGLRKSLGLVTAREVKALIDHPPFDNSLMDGFAVRAGDLSGVNWKSPGELEVIETVRAGHMPAKKVASGFCARIMTGAPIPEGANAVVRLEDAEPGKDSVSFFNRVKEGSYVKKAGEDFWAGLVVLESGLPMNPARAALAAAAGHREVEVFPRPKVGIVVTGDELVEEGGELLPGKIYNSNGCALNNQVVEAGGWPMEYGIGADNLKSLQKLLQNAFDECDVVVTSGGAAMGEYDLIEDALKNLGASILFTEISQRPGRHMVAAVKDGKLFFGLPGNPAAMIICFEIYVRPIIRKILGFKECFRPRCVGSFNYVFEKTKGLTGWARVNVERAKGLCRLMPTATPRIGMLRSLAEGDGLAELPAELDAVTPETPVKVRLFGNPGE